MNMQGGYTSNGGEIAEQWRDVPGYEGRLQVSYNGFVKQFKAAGGYWWDAKQPAPNRNGYVVVVDNRERLRMHTLVALAFLGPRPDGCTVDHIDRNRSNNNVSNLRWATKAEQMANRKACTKREKISKDNVLSGEIFRRWSDAISVSQFGRILSRQSIFQPTPGSRDYATVSKNRKTYMLHRIVAEVWSDIVGDKPGEGYTVDHIDRNCANNMASNLRWLTPSQQAYNRNIPEKRSSAEIVDQKPVEVAAPYIDEIRWVRYESYTGAALAIAESTRESFTQNQVGQIVRKHPGGYTATKGTAKGWSFRLLTNGGDEEAVPVKKARLSQNTARVPVDARAPGSDNWIHYNSSLQASHEIKKEFHVQISSGSISRFVNLHPDGHTVSSKQNAGWSFRRCF